MPKKCPICGSPVEKKTIGSGDTQSAAHYCTNKNCFAVEKENIIHFVSRKGMNIEGLGEKIIEQLIDEGLIANSADLYELEAGDLAPLERFAEKSAQNIVDAIEASKSVALPKFLFALGIHHVGEETAVLLAETFGSIEEIRDAKKDDFDAIEGIGGVVAQSIYDWFREEKNKKLLSRLLEHVNVEARKKTVKSRKLEGKTFVLTGALGSFTREEAKSYIKENGGGVTSSVSKNTDYLVAGEDPGEAKYEKAKELNVEIIDEEGLRGLVR